MFRDLDKMLKAKILVLLVVFLSFGTVHAQTSVSDLEAKINQRNADITALEKEIQGYQAELNVLSEQKSSLSSTIKSLDITQKKLQADISVTVDKIDATNLKIQQLVSRIDTTQNTITDDVRYVMESLRTINQLGGLSLPELLLASGSFSAAWRSVDELSELQDDLAHKIDVLQAAKVDLESNKLATEKAKTELVKLQAQLNSQRKVVLATQAEKNDLLKQTKSSESSYQKLLANKQALKEAFEQEISQYESQLKISIDLSKLPSTGRSILSWPLDKVFITQYFGNTPFATANPQIYKTGSHNGIDLRASIGTPVKAALSGVVQATGNTNLYVGCYSLGKWIVLKHPNGLSTLYAHLSLQTVSVGQGVSTGTVIGYSGNTGASTGPHLHLGVYATAGLGIRPFSESQNCKNVVIPMITAIGAHLNPLSYLPAYAN